jgi:PAS domain S-box-containing protein
MTIAVLTVGILIINELTQQQHQQLLQVELGKVQSKISDHLSLSEVNELAIEAEKLQAEIRKELHFDSIRIYVMQSPDKIIYHPDHKYGDKIQGHNIQALLKHGSGHTEYSYQDTKHFAVYSAIRPNGWVIFLSLEMAEMFVNEAEYFRNIVLTSITIFIFTAIAVSFFVRRVASRLQVTLNGVKKIEEGDLRARIPVTANDEFGLLQTGINAMSANIQTRALEQKETEQALRDSESKFRNLVQKINAAIIVHSADSNIISANTMAQNFLGLREDQLKGKAANDAVWHFLREDGSKMPLEEYPVNRVLSSHTPLQNLVVGVERQDSAEPIWALVNALPVTDEIDGNMQVIVSFTDITERKKTEQELANSEQLFRTLVENSPNHIARYDLNLRRVYLNPAIAKQFKVPREELLGKTSKVDSPLLDPESYMDNLRKAIDSKQEVSDEIAFRSPEGIIHWAKSRFAPEFDLDGKVKSVLVISDDITEQKLAESERLDTMHFLQSLDRINRVLKAEGEIEEILNQTLETVLDIFECDRAYLLYPADPESPTWSVPIERTVPKYPGAFELGAEIPMNDLVAWQMKLALDSDHPVTGGPDNEYPVVEPLREEFSIRAFIVMSLYPKVDKPWQFGIQQCGYDRVWSDQEVRLLEEIGHRLSDGLNSLLVSQNLRISEERFRLVFESSPVPIQEEDYSAVKQRLEALRSQYKDNLDDYLKRYPEVIEECASLVRIIDVNKASLKLHEAETKQEVLRGITQVFAPRTIDDFRHLLISLANNETDFRRETELITLSGRKHYIDSFLTVCPGYEENLAKVFVSLVDISEQKLAEKQRKEHLHFLESLDRINRVLHSEGNIQEILKKTLDVVLEIFDCDRAYLQYPCDPGAVNEWQMPMERCKPEYPTPLPVGSRLPYHPHIAETLQALLDSDVPIRLGPDTNRPIPEEITKNLGVRSLLATAIYPKVDRPWHFGIHQCSYDRVWSEQELRLLEEIGHRLSDGLNVLLVTQNLRESEERFRLVYENSPVSIWVEDFSDVKDRLNSLTQTIDSDIESYLISHPETVAELATLVRIVDINNATLELFEATSKEALYQGLHKTFIPESYEAFRRELVAIAEGQTRLAKGEIVRAQLLR